MNRRFEDTPLGQLLKFWPMVVSFAIVIFTISIIKANVDDHDMLLKVNSEDHKVFSEKIAKLEEISSLIPEMRCDIKEIAKELRSQRR